MRLLALQVLTWGTVAGAAASAFWLASIEPGWTHWRNPFNSPVNELEVDAALAARAPPPEFNATTDPEPQLVSKTR
jgi:hypothetical protein